ncbi:hypothetical protein CRV24_003504 [Beauveria bassiana]|nr:hypothetical protein CRV24_003504 [Beauveria bassiana]
MKTATVATSFLASTFAVSAQSVQSEPFNIQLKSYDTGVNGNYIGACHSGAAIENLCLTNRPVTMHLNSTRGQDPNNGLLTWLLPSNLPVDSAMRLIPDPSTNVAQAVFFPGPVNGQQVRFIDDELFLVSSIDDTKDPIEVDVPKPIANWYICNTYFTGYRYKTLSWVYGKAGPQNPTCVKVSVRRNFE